ncbi:DUF3893 domain-containing protein [Actinomadura spongiicola]|uniref:DUF3893 domain-containing protein n=2 Tax=Actinomadura spongiicola TaxID=2303421 RepID=A0A372G876_9ACTN|nr:DUF3893 domain-containing protein [Actinomadura spongiicola]
MHTLALPADWEAPIRRLYQHGMTPQQAERRQLIPTKSINQLMRALAPDLLSVDHNATFGTDQPWLYAASPYPTRIINSFVGAWLRDLQQKPEDPESASLLHKTFRLLDASGLTWQPANVDLLEQTTSAGGTSLPASHLYRLLPDVLAARIAAQPAYEHNGKTLQFRQVAGDAKVGGAELMSWPPRTYQSNNKDDDGKKTWYYSAYIRLSLRTVPFSPVPRIHLSTGIRRFVRGQVWMPTEGGVSVYLLPDESLIPDGPTPHRFSVAMMEWNRGTTDWRHGGPQGMLLGVSALDQLPPVDRLVKEADRWIDGPNDDNIAVAVSHHAAMGYHAIGTGLMPSERRRLTEWAEQALAPDFLPVPLLTRSRYSKPAKKQLEKRRSIPKKELPEEKLAAILAENEAISGRNALRRRKHLAEAIDGLPFVAVVLYQTEGMRNRIIQAAERGLDLVSHRVEDGPETWTWRTEEIEVKVHALPIGELAAPLGGDSPPAKGGEHNQQITSRRHAVAAFIKKLKVKMPGAQVAFVELDGKERFAKSKRRADPKYAIRLGLADAGLVSQFFRPLDPDMEPDEAEADAVFRAEAAWLDGLRQTGMRFVPLHSLGDSIPENLNQLAFWLVKRRSDGPTNRAQFTPIAVLLRPGQKCIMGKTADMSEWVPYPQLLRSLTSHISKAELKTAAQQSAATAAFVKKTLSAMRGSPTLVLVRAQNIRYRWPWLLNRGLVQDRIGFDSGPLQRIGLIGKQLRFIRVADSERDETAEWWAPAELLSEKHEGKQRGGIAKGLWVAQDSYHVFYSSADRASTHPVSSEMAKLTSHVNDKGYSEFKPTKNAWNPELLELVVACMQPGDDPEKWAMFVHQQRLCDDYRDVLGLPLALHLAKLADHYALPQEEVETITDTSSEESPSEQLMLDIEPIDHS